MALSNSETDSIMLEYDETRLNNRRIGEERTKYVYSLLPEYKELEDRIVDLSLDSVKKRLSGDTEASRNIHEKISELSAKKAELLKSAGLPSDYLDPIYTCKDCKDTGYIGSEKCHCLKKRITGILYDQSNIRTFLLDNNFSKLSLDYFEGEDLDNFQNAVNKSRQMIANFDKEPANLLFMGTVGTGKSFLSGCIAKELLDANYSCIYYTSIGLFESLAKETFHSDSRDTLYNLFEVIYNCDLLIIDDLGTENTNSFIASQLFALLNERTLRKKSTIISTNLSLKDLRDRYSDRVFSRLVSSFNVCRLSGPDLRIQIKQSQSRK